MEDQPTDRSDLTATANEPAASGVEKPVPVGKRGGRHRSFRPRSAAATAGSADATAEAASVAETVEAEVSAVDESTEVIADPTVKPKRRRWFRRQATDVSGDEATEEATIADEVGTGGPGEESDAATQISEWPETELRVRKPAGRRITIAVAAAAALFVAAGAFGGAMLQPYLSDRAVANTKLDIAQTATDAITTLFTYTPEDMDQLPDRSAKYLGGELKDEYTKQVDALAATNKQNQIHRDAQVVGTAVESLSGPDATAMVYANITYPSAATKDLPKIYLVSYRLTMQRKGSDWVITHMPWITSKDLTRVTP